MKTKPSVIHTRRKQLDRILSAIVPLRNLKTPKRGWAYQIRTSLGISAALLAKRMNVAKTTVVKLEGSEASRTISLASLERLANAMNCKLVYAIVPSESLDTILKTQAEQVAKKIVQQVQRTMSLEAQSGTKIEQDDQIADIANELVRTLRSDLWRE